MLPPALMVFLLLTAPLTSQRLKEICSRAPPTHQAGNTLPQGAAHVHGGQTPISVEYQIYIPAIDTLVTGMTATSITKTTTTKENTTTTTTTCFYMTLPSIRRCLLYVVAFYFDHTLLLHLQSRAIVKVELNSLCSSLRFL